MKIVGLSRREALWVGALGGVGLTLPQLLAAEAQAQPIRPKSILLVVPWGGPATLDTFDLKPDAPAEVRSEFRPTATAIPGLRICEHLPRLARLAGQYAIIRSATHTITTHNSATHYALTGHPPAITNRELVPAQRTDWPSIGSVLARLQPGQRSVPAYAMAPCPLIDNGAFTGGQNAGFLGTSFDPFVVTRDPSRSDFVVPGLALQTNVTPKRLDRRRVLVERLETGMPESPAPVRDLAMYSRKAYDLLRSTASKQAFDIGQEPAKVRDRYGMTRYGQSVLLARRLIEAGVRVVLVGDTLENTNDRWDTHGGEAHVRIKKNLGETDLALSALLEDLRERGLLETTIVLWMAEFGRTPRLHRGGGRDHWPHCYSLLLAGGGIQGGRVHGSSDRNAAYPRDNPCKPEDIHATLFQLLGVPLDTHLTDPLGRPVRLCEGEPIRGVI
jgi:hypothetical protein